LRIKKEAERIKLEQEAKEKLKIQEIDRKRRELPEEPSESDNNIATIVIRLPDGNRLTRRLRRTDKLQVLYDFIDISQKQIEMNKYILVASYPRQTFPDPNVTIEEAKLYPQALLFMQEK